MQKINEQWFAGLKGEERDKMKELVLSNTILLDKLREMLYNIQVSKESTVLADYDTPSWSHKQAHRNGQLDIIRQFDKLLTISERDDQPQI